MKNQLYNFIELISIIGFFFVGFSTEFIWFLFLTLLGGFFLSLFRTLFIFFKSKNSSKDILLFRIISVVALFVGFVFLWTKILHIQTFFSVLPMNKITIFIIVYIPIFWYIFTILSEWKVLKSKDFNTDTVDDIIIK